MTQCMPSSLEKYNMGHYTIRNWHCNTKRAYEVEILAECSEKDYSQFYQ